MDLSSTLHFKIRNAPMRLKETAIRWRNWGFWIRLAPKDVDLFFLPLSQISYGEHSRGGARVSYVGYVPLMSPSCSHVSVAAITRNLPSVNCSWHNGEYAPLAPPGGRFVAWQNESTCTSQCFLPIDVSRSLACTIYNQIYYHYHPQCLCTASFHFIWVWSIY